MATRELHGCCCRFSSRKFLFEGKLGTHHNTAIWVQCNYILGPSRVGAKLGLNYKALVMSMGFLWLLTKFNSLLTDVTSAMIDSVRISQDYKQVLATPIRSYT